MGDQQSRDALARSIAARVHALRDAGDELRVLDGFLLRLELGRERVGPLDLEADDRDWSREIDEERADIAVYQEFRASARSLKRISERDA